MNFNAIDHKDFGLVIVRRNHHNTMSPINQRFGQVVGTNGSACGRCFEVLVYEQDIHAANK